MEHCVFNNIKDELSGLISARQHGFQSGKSCITNLLESLDNIGPLLDRGSQIDSVYLDMSKTFDKVRHDLLLHKLQEAASGGNLLRWFSSCLIGRRQHVTLLGTFSRELPVTSGVPQRFILGPALLLIYVNSLPSAVWNSEVMTFAVDTKIYRETKFSNDRASLQEDFDSLSARSADSELSLNETKCKVETITRKQRPISASYQITGCVIKSTASERDLGESVSSDLTWNNWVYEQAARANKLLGYIQRNAKYTINTSVRRTLYVDLVCPYIGYATQVWVPQSIELISKLESIQRRAAKKFISR